MNGSEHAVIMSSADVFLGISSGTPDNYKHSTHYFKNLFKKINDQEKDLPPKAFQINAGEIREAIPE